MVVDLRSAVGARERPYMIPGALRISPEELERRHAEFPRDAEIVLYCT
jgi:rhodanese-related sulfurtransferase